VHRYSFSRQGWALLRIGTNRERQPDLQQAKLLTDDNASPDPEVGPVIRRSDLLIRESEGETLLYDPASGRAHWLNATAAVIWELIDGVASRADLVEIVGDIFALEPGEAQAGVDTVVDEFLAQGLLGQNRESPLTVGGASDEPGTPEASVAPPQPVATGPVFLGVPPNL
jgi:coenzyme PQQ synthesis protein D (PqqD)